MHQTLLSIVSTTSYSTICFLIYFVSFNYKFILFKILFCSKISSPILAIYASSDYLLLPNIEEPHQCRNTLSYFFLFAWSFLDITQVIWDWATSSGRVSLWISISKGDFMFPSTNATFYNKQFSLLSPGFISSWGFRTFGCWFIKASPIRFLILVRCLQDLFSVSCEYKSSRSPSWVNVLEVLARFKAQLTCLDPYGFWGYLLSCQHIDVFKNIFYYFNYFSMRELVTVNSVSYYWKTDFLSLKIIYSYNKFKIGMKRMKRSFMNNSINIRSWTILLIYVLSYLFTAHSVMWGDVLHLQEMPISILKGSQIWKIICHL